MDKWTKILFASLIFLTVLSVSATFYKTVILQDFDITGVYVEFPTKDTSSVWFVYDNKEYELELETVNYDEIVAAIASELAISETELDADFLEYLQTAYDEGEVVDDGGEEVGGEGLEEEPTENDETNELFKKTIETGEGKGVSNEEVIKTRIITSTSTDE